jgi:hypothetical protein
MLTRWECKITEAIEVEGREAIPFLHFAPTTHAEILYGCPWPTNEITVTKQEGAGEHTFEYMVKDPAIYTCVAEAMAAAILFRDELITFIDLWRNNYADVNYKVTGD